MSMFRIMWCESCFHAYSNRGVLPSVFIKYLQEVNNNINN